MGYRHVPVNTPTVRQRRRRNPGFIRLNKWRLLFWAITISIFVFGGILMGLFWIMVAGLFGAFGKSPRYHRRTYKWRTRSNTRPQYDPQHPYDGI